MILNGKILSPASGKIISQVTNVKGEIPNLVPGYHYWLFVQKSNGVVWPKESEIKNNYWERILDYGYPSQDFKLLLIATDKIGYRSIENWHRFGRLTGSYPGLLLDDFNQIQILSEVKISIN